MDEYEELERDRSIEHDAIPHVNDGGTVYKQFWSLPLDDLLDRLIAALQRMEYMNGSPDVCWVLEDLTEQAEEAKQKYKKLLISVERIERAVQLLQIDYGQNDTRVAFGVWTKDDNTDQENAV